MRKRALVTLGAYALITVVISLAASERWQKKDFAVFADRFEYTAGAHFTVDRYRD
jgi:hypothetical protein